MIAREIGKGNAGSPARVPPRGRPSIPACKAREDLGSKRPCARKEHEQAAPSVLRARDLAHVELAHVVFAKYRRVPVERTGDDRGENTRAGNIPECRVGAAGQLAIEKARHPRNSEFCMIRHVRCPGASVEHRDESETNGRGIMLYASLEYLEPRNVARMGPRRSPRRPRKLFEILCSWALGLAAMPSGRNPGPARLGVGPQTARAAGLGGRVARITPASALRRKPGTYCRMIRRSADICLLHGKGVTEADSARGRRLPASSSLCACYLFQQFGVAQHGAPLEARRRDCALGEGAAARFNVVDRVPPMH